MTGLFCLPDSTAQMNHSLLGKLRLMGTIEGISTLCLFFIAMPLKYMAGMPIAVKIAGSIHGALFIGLGLITLMAINKVPIPFKLSVIIMIGAVLPFGPFVVDAIYLKKLGDK